jgi:hypothetical protein
MLKRPQCEAESIPHSAEIKNRKSYTSTPPIRFHGVDRYMVILKLFRHHNCSSTIISHTETISFSALDCLLMLYCYCHLYNKPKAAVHAREFMLMGPLEEEEYCHT